MLTVNPLTVTYERVAAFNKVNENHLGNSLLNLASGKKIRKPQDNIVDYFHAQRLNAQAQDYNRIGQEVSEASAILKVASNAGETVFNSVKRMEEIANVYYKNSTDSEQKAALKSEFTAIISQVNKVINNATYNGDQVIRDSHNSPLKSVIINNKSLQKINISFSAEQITDVNGLTLGVDEDTEKSAIQAQLGRAGSYLGRVSALSRGLDAQYAIASKTVNVSSNQQSALTKADTGKEIFTAMNRSIQHQSSLAMLAQANIAHNSVVRLFG